MKIYIFSKRKIAIVLIAIVLILGIIILINTSYNPFAKAISTISSPKKLPIYSVETDEKKIAISFDAAWGDQFTDDILDTLDDYDVKTTFFLVGFWVDKYPDMVKKIHDRGHEIGNHSTTHPHMSELSREEIIEEIKTTEKKIEDITGVRTNLFRPPFGDYNNQSIEVLEELGYHTIQWDVDSLDWKELGAHPVVDRVTRNIKKGSIVLFHNNAKYVSEYLPLVLEKLKEQNYEIVPISELIIKEDYTIDSSGRQHRAAN
ncbi:MAG: polysaccharide deacetylase family sporulation protein PdaB [Clostridiales bacterium]|nr:polysaccharide deacetylase family sporulation protein PdaB [Clostridiales bacterium]